MDLEQRLRDFLNQHAIPFEEISHDEAQTCESAAEARGRPQAIGGKTVLFKAKKNFFLFTISNVEKIDSQKVRKILKSDRLRFATPEELWEQTGAVKGALPPFGKPLLPFELYVDESILKNEEIAFNAGVLTTSFILKTEDYFKLHSPQIASFAKDPHQSP